MSPLRVNFLHRDLHWLARTRRLGVCCCVATNAAKHYVKDKSQAPIATLLLTFKSGGLQGHGEGARARALVNLKVRASKSGPQSQQGLKSGLKSGPRLVRSMNFERQGVDLALEFGGQGLIDEAVSFEPRFAGKDRGYDAHAKMALARPGRAAVAGM